METGEFSLLATNPNCYLYLTVAQVLLPEMHDCLAVVSTTRLVAVNRTDL